MCVSVCVYVYGTVETKAQAASADTFKHRLEQLDDIEEVCACVCVCVCVCACVLKTPDIYAKRVLHCLHCVCRAL